LQVPEFQVPEFQVPEFQVPEFQVPEFQVRCALCQPRQPTSAEKLMRDALPGFWSNTLGAGWRRVVLVSVRSNFQA
jgi:hypothetical protein